MAGAHNKRDQKKRMIFDAAIKLMNERSFDEVTIKDICEAASISNGMFFYYFKTKDELLSLYLTDAYDDFLVDHEPPAANTGDFITEIVDLYHCYIDYCEQAGIRFISSYYNTGNKALNTHDFSGSKTMNTTMMRDLSFLMGAQQMGYVEPTANLIQIDIDCCSIVKGLIFEWCICDGGFDPKESAGRILANYLAPYATAKYQEEFGTQK